MDAGRSRNASIVIALLHLGLFLGAAWIIFQSIRAFPIPFDTDEADHANAAIELYYAVKSHLLLTVWEAIQRQAFYPPVYSFIVAVSYAIFSPSVFASRFPALLSFLGAGIILCVAVHRAALHRQPTFRILGATLPAILIGSSPLLIENSSLCMIELFAVFLTSLLFILPAENHLSNRSIQMIALIVCATFFAKYNFGILVIAGTLAAFWIKPPLSFPGNRSELRQSLAILLFFLAALGLWFLLSHPSSIKHFFVGHPSYSPMLSSTNLLFELTAWVKEYSPNIVVGVLTLFLALWGAFTHKELFAVRIAYCVTGASFVILLLSTTNESRHFIVAAPCIWYLCSLGWIDILSKGSKYFFIGVLFLFSIYVGLFSTIPKIPGIVTNAMEGDIAFAELQEGIFNAIDSSKPTLFIGVSDQFGIEALKWQGARAAKVLYTQIHFDSFPYKDEKNFTAVMRQRTSAAPYTNTSFPKNDIHQVLATGYYKALVLLRTVGDRSDISAMIKSLKESHSDRILYQKTAGKLEVTVIELP